MACPLDLLSPVYWKSKRGQARWQDILGTPVRICRHPICERISYVSVSFIELIQVHGWEGGQWSFSYRRSTVDATIDIVSSTITYSVKYNTIFPSKWKNIISLFLYRCVVFYLFVITCYYLQFDCSFVIPFFFFGDFLLDVVASNRFNLPS